VSDHGFTRFDHKVHLNRWLVEQGYLVSRNNGESNSLQDVDWSKSQAYAIGLNSLYLNIAGREGQGCVHAGEIDALTRKLRSDLLHWKGPDGLQVVKQVGHRDEVIAGPYAPYGPDLLVGYAPGYRGSAETGLGRWQSHSIERNHDHWGADHCIDPQSVPGVLFSNQGLHNFPNPSYCDMPALTIDAALDGKSAPPPPPPAYGNEEQAAVEERLKSLGYL
jgi:hypothetical protein